MPRSQCLHGQGKIAGVQLEDQRGTGVAFTLTLLPSSDRLHTHEIQNRLCEKRCSVVLSHPPPLSERILVIWPVMRSKRSCASAKSCWNKVVAPTSTMSFAPLFNNRLVSIQKVESLLAVAAREQRRRIILCKLGRPMSR